MKIEVRGGRRMAGLFLGIGASLLSQRDAAAQALGASWSGSGAGKFGAAIANAGDVDGDGVDDLMVGEPFYFPTGGNTYEGRVTILSGGSHAVIRIHDGTQAQEQLGHALSGAGDVDGDGHADYAIGSYQHASNGFTGNGEVVVYSGIDGSVIWSVDGAATNAYVGFSVAAIDDVDGDGKGDLLVGDYNGDVNVYDANGGVIYTLSGQQSALFGYSLASCGDLDGDGVRDFLIGAPYYTGGTPSVNFCGGAFAFSAKSGTPLCEVLGDNVNDNLGFVVSSLGDVDGDNVPDLLAGSYASPGNGPLSGMVRVASGATGATIRTVYGDTVNDRLGGSLVDMGDMDGDGVPDYAAATLDGPAPYLGRVRVYSGSDGAVLHEWLGKSLATEGNGDLGSALATGDFNLDGAADLVIGDQSYSLLDPIRGVWTQPGCAFLYYGCPASSSNYGAGWPGKNGIPGIVALNKPVPGGPLTIQIDNSLGAATTGILFVGFSPANLPTNKGGTILVSPALTVVLPIGATGLTLNGSLPDDPNLYFFDFYMQAVEVDPFASKGLSFTPGLKLHCGFDL
jgi:hypothetical protein